LEYRWKFIAKISRWKIKAWELMLKRRGRFYAMFATLMYDAPSGIDRLR